MAIELETLNNERVVLKKDFDNLTQKIAQVEKDLVTMRSNLNAVYGALQQVDKLIKLSSGDVKISSEKEKALNLATS
jgi:predicted  nucleic acid-binding Zn-ribbon protein